jgi:hypothetical protein
VEGLNGLSCLLQAVPKAGHQVINAAKVLPRVVEIAVIDPRPKNEFAAECLALASSDTTVRSTIAEGGYSEIFLDLLDSDDDNVSANAAVALAKLVFLDKEISGEVIDSMLAAVRTQFFFLILSGT